MRKLRLRWTCSDFCDHYHRWKWTAAICGKIQFYLFKIGYSRVCYPKFFMPERVKQQKGTNIYVKHQ